jgi:hypothetical protein
MLGKHVDVRLRRGFVLKRGVAPHADYAAKSVRGLRPSGQRSAVPIRSWRIGLLLGQKKVAKEKAARLPLESCAPRFRREAIEGPSLALDRRAESILRPLRVIPAESSGARRGKREENTRLCPLKQLYPHSTGEIGNRLTVVCFGIDHCSIKRISVSFPYGDPEHRSLGPEQPERAREGSRAATEGQGWPFGRPRSEARSAGLRAPFGRPFFWVLFFGRTKKSISPAGRDPHPNNPPH